jgi:RNA polymerase sigma-70 factor, ECF subfamily
MTTPMDEDYLYIEQFLAGKQEGFEMLVRKYQSRVLNIVYSLIGQDRESDDIMQEVFMKVYHNLGSFRKRSKFSTWLYRIVVNTVNDFLRKRKNFISGDDALETVAVSGDGPRDAMLKREHETIVEKAIGNIPLKFRTALVLKDMEGMSYLEISRILHCSMGTVESKIYRARQCFKKELRKLGGDIT